MTYREWLDKYGDESCVGCPYNNAVRVHCSYKGKCVRYDEYRRDFARKEEGSTLFD